MKYLRYRTEGKKTSEIRNEILYMIASARAIGAELVRIDITFSDAKSDKNLRTALRFLKELKSAGKIQLYATKESFLASAVEAQYLLNKYAERIAFDSDDSFVYVKL